MECQLDFNTTLAKAIIGYANGILYLAKNELIETLTIDWINLSLLPEKPLTSPIRFLLCCIYSLV